MPWREMYRNASTGPGFGEIDDGFKILTPLTVKSLGLQKQTRHNGCKKSVSKQQEVSQIASKHW